MKRILKQIFLHTIDHMAWFRDQCRSLLYGRGRLKARAAGSNNAAMVTVVNDDFAPYMAVLLHSFKKHNPSFSCPWIILWGHTYAPLSQYHREVLERLYPHVQFLEVDEKRYETLLSKTPAKWLAALFTLETFSLCQYDRVCFIDADIVCLGDVSRLLEVSAPLIACRSGNEYRDKQKRKNMFVWDGGFNSGVFVIGQEHLNTETYEALFRVPYKDFGDQEILNNYFRGKPVYIFPHEYNYHAEFFWDAYGHDDDVRLLHYAGAKPLQKPELPRMKPWLDAAKEIVGEHPELADLFSLNQEQ